MAGWSNSRMRIPALATMMVLVLMTMTQCAAAYNMAGRKFTIDNIYPYNPNPPCPDANPNTVTFYPSSSNPLQGTVTIVGEFEGADIGVCSNSNYGVTPGTNITYAVYGDWIIYQIPGRVSAASKIVYQQGHLYAIGIDQNFYVSQLTDAGPAS